MGKSVKQDQDDGPLENEEFVHYAFLLLSIAKAYIVARQCLNGKKFRNLHHE
jgi:hypothetical protein